jgi:CheY-like chemotaxis protein
MKKAPLSILIIDDDAELAELVEAIVQQEGWQTIACTDSTLALGTIRRILPDVILCDARMPGMSGQEIVARLRSESSTARIPVVLMSGLAEAEIPSAGWAAFVQKPFTPAELVAAVSRAARGASARVSLANNVASVPSGTARGASSLLPV